MASRSAASGRDSGAAAGGAAARGGEVRDWAAGMASAAANTATPTQPIANRRLADASID
jgi:hypothetical protein